MYVTFGPYANMQIRNIESISPPFPKCCSSVDVMCPRCAAEVLRRRGAGCTVNQLSNDDFDILPLPTINWAETGPDGDYDDADVGDNLPLPKINWAKKNGRDTGANHCDTLPLPKM